MQKKLVIEAFKKARRELELKGINGPSNHQVAILISDFMLNEIDFSISKRSIANYYNSANEVLDSEDINISQNNVVLGLCKYLGYFDYKDFMENIESTDREEAKHILNTKTDKSLKIDSKIVKRNFGIVISIIAVLIIGLVIFMTSNKDRWMVWKEDHYEEADFDQNELSNGALEFFKEERIANFKKINNPNCDYKFFNEDGSVNVWYGKNKKGELEIFTEIGLHPETGKSLKPITAYMIRKYICDSY